MTAAKFTLGNETLIKVLDGASARLGGLLKKQGRLEEGGLRVAVVGGGCSGLQYKMDLVDGPRDRDIMVESNGVRVVIDPKSALFVTGSELDFSDDLQSGGFKVTNPNAVVTCSCGESFAAQMDMDAFAELGFPRRATLDSAEVCERFRERGKTLHPDGGAAPDAAALERANQAAATLENPATRLRHFLDLEFGPAPGHSGTIAPRLMDIFAEVGSAVQLAEAVAIKKRSAQTALAQALLAREVVAAQQKLVTAGATVRAAITDCESRLPEIDDGAPQDQGEVLYRELAFLGKWQREIQAKFSALF